MPKDLSWELDVAGAVRNARVVTPETEIFGGLAWRDGRIVEVTDGDAGAAAGGVDFDDDYLLPGLVDLHTDNLEKHFSPRPNVTWDPVLAAVAHDAQVAAAGVTTVFDSLCVGQSIRQVDRVEWLEPMLDGVARARAAGLLRVDHRLHLRCEVTDPGTPALFDSLTARFDADFVSVMDHAPGHRQSPDVDRYIDLMSAYIEGDRATVEGQVDALIERSGAVGPTVARAIAERAAAKRLALASHDDDRAEHVAFAKGLGAIMSEFPTTMPAAEAARDAGLLVAGGAPNIVRGGSHSGNASVLDMARANALDAVCSDYVPAAMLTAIFRLTEPDVGWSLARAVAAGSLGPAQAAGLTDRGALTPGLMADMLRVRMVDGRPHVMAVWREGRRVS